MRAGLLRELALGVEGGSRRLQAKVCAFATSELAGGTDITSHCSSAPQTRRFFGGRHPLCGIGVTSMMFRILYPTLFSERTADSRPGPGPLMRTSSDFTP